MRYHLELTGYVGADNFNSNKTDNLLRQYPQKHVDVLIDSTGGSLAHGLSIAGAFRNHGDVTAHMRGMCASAATIAAMGAKHIAIEPDAFFLVHKVLISFFNWSAHNADTLQKYIEALTEQKKNLENLDASVAATYAARCKKPVNELLDLMKDGKWLTAKQALEWGFVDEIKESEDSRALKLTKAQADIFAAQGLPIPPLEIVPENSSLYNELKKLFKSHFSMNSEPKTPQSPQDPQAQSPEPKKPESNNEEAQNSQESIESLKAELEAVKKEKAEIKAKYDELAKSPAQSTSSVVDNPAPSAKEEKDPFADFLATTDSASKLFNALP